MARSELSRKRKGNAIQPTQQRRSEIRKWRGGWGGGGAVGAENEIRHSISPLPSPQPQ